MSLYLIPFALNVAAFATSLATSTAVRGYRWIHPEKGPFLDPKNPRDALRLLSSTSLNTLNTATLTLDAANCRSIATQLGSASHGQGAFMAVYPSTLRQAAPLMAAGATLAHTFASCAYDGKEMGLCADHVGATLTKGPAFAAAFITYAATSIALPVLLGAGEAAFAASPATGKALLTKTYTDLGKELKGWIENPADRADQEEALKIQASLVSRIPAIRLALQESLALSQESTEEIVKELGTYS